MRPVKANGLKLNYITQMQSKIKNDKKNLKIEIPMSYQLTSNENSFSNSGEINDSNKNNFSCNRQSIAYTKHKNKIKLNYLQNKSAPYKTKTTENTTYGGIITYNKTKRKSFLNNHKILSPSRVNNKKEINDCENKEFPKNKSLPKGKFNKQSKSYPKLRKYYITESNYNKYEANQKNLNGNKVNSKNKNFVSTLAQTYSSSFTPKGKEFKSKLINDVKKNVNYSTKISHLKPKKIDGQIKTKPKRKENPFNYVQCKIIFLIFS